MCNSCENKKKKDFIYIRSLAIKYKLITGENVAIFRVGEFFDFAPLIDIVPQNVIEII